jgi:hypothetical protein
MGIAMPNVTEVWSDTGKIVERDFTPDEIKQRKADEKADRERQAEKARQAETRAATVNHAKSLGFTDKMIKVMYPTLIVEDTTEE